MQQLRLGSGSESIKTSLFVFILVQFSTVGINIELNKHYGIKCARILFIQTHYETHTTPQINATANKTK